MLKSFVSKYQGHTVRSIGADTFMECLQLSYMNELSSYGVKIANKQSNNDQTLTLEGQATMMDHVIDFKLTCQTTYPLDMKKYDCVTTFRVDGGSMHFSKLDDVAQQMAIAVQKQSDMKMAA